LHGQICANLDVEYIFPSVGHVMQHTLKVICSTPKNCIFYMQIAFKVRCTSKFGYFQVFCIIRFADFLGGGMFASVP